MSTIVLCLLLDFMNANVIVFAIVIIFIIYYGEINK